MKNTLYLLRKSLDQVQPALFVASRSKGDVVLLDRALAPFPHDGGRVLSLGTVDEDASISYDTLVRKIFDSDDIIVI